MDHNVRKFPLRQLLFSEKQFKFEKKNNIFKVIKVFGLGSDCFSVWSLHTFLLLFDRIIQIIMCDMVYVLSKRHYYTPVYEVYRGYIVFTFSVWMSVC